MHLLLYIPIWFYSNGVSNSDSLTKANFTFQSGSIQIEHIFEHNLSTMTLHSNLVLFKFVTDAMKSSDLQSLHSNLVLFKLKELYQSELQTVFTFQSGYIQMMQGF